MARSLWAILLCLTCWACGPAGPAVPPAKFETFTVAWEAVDAGQEYSPTDRFRARVVYKGDLARNLRLSVTLTDTATGETATDTLSSPQQQDDASLDLRTTWLADADILKRPGLYEARLTATINATKRDSPTWTAETAQPLLLRAAPRLDSVTLTPLTVGAPTPYGTAMTVSVAGNQLWDDVTLTVDNLDTGQPVPGLSLVLPSSAPRASLGAPWTLSAPALDHVAVHHLRVTATFGALVAHSAPFDLEVTHTIDQVGLRVRDANDVAFPATGDMLRMDHAKDFLLHVAGTNLAGHEVRLNAEAPFVAPADAFDLVRTPTQRDFEDGKGTHRFEYAFSAGGTRRTAEVEMRRWAFDSCSWTNGAITYTDGQVVDAGTVVTLRASGWGFPDTQGILFLKTHQAHFKIWERDYGQNNTNLPQPFINNDDEVASFDADMFSSNTSLTWTTRHEEEVEFLHLNRAELYFEVRMEDQMCRAAEIRVPPP